MWVLQIYTYSQQHVLYFKDRHRISSNHTIISCLCGCLILTFKCAQVCYWVRAIEAQIHSRNIMKWDTKAVQAILTSGPAIDIPAPDLTVISTQQRRGEVGRREWQIIMTIAQYCMLLKCAHVTDRSVWSRLVQGPVGEVWAAVDLVFV